ncbi:MAG: CDGSH-type Zn-finger protein [Arcticibacterium sp.]|jgi:CDGSH-type Zn-finger protein
MSKVKIVDRKPIKVALKAGDDQYWCACGLSKNQPFCDGSHSTTDIFPTKFIAKKSADAYLCLCKHTKNPPYCDGTHAKLKEADD